MSDCWSLFREDGQKRFLGLDNSPMLRLKNLGLYSAYGRLVRADLIKCWKIFHSERNIGMLNIFLLVVDRRTQGRSLKIVLPRCDQELEIFSCLGHSEVECSAGACSHASFTGDI